MRISSIIENFYNLASGIQKFEFFISAADLNTQNKQIVLMKFLGNFAKSLGVGKHVYIVGGAVRNFILGAPIKDVDIVVDSIALGKDSEWFAKQIAEVVPAKTTLVTNQYGVAILSISESWTLNGFDMKGETIEIANARKESYSGAEGKGKGYKPTDVAPATIEEDIYRREFTFNTLLWRLNDLVEGPEKAEIIDLTGRGQEDLKNGMVRTPMSPDKTFGDDPTRMLRAIKFIARYGFKVPPDVQESIASNAPKLKRMPWDAVRKILVKDILEGPAPRRAIGLLKELGLATTINEMCKEIPAFSTALSRALADAPAELLLDLLDMNFAIKTPISFLDDKERNMLRDILSKLPEQEGRAVFEAIKKPPLPNQQELFERYQIEPKNRRNVWHIARKLIFNNPELAWKPKELRNETENVIKRGPI